VSRCEEHFTGSGSKHREGPRKSIRWNGRAFFFFFSQTSWILKSASSALIVINEGKVLARPLLDDYVFTLLQEVYRVMFSIPGEGTESGASKAGA
jgi:hypothetical protein